MFLCIKILWKVQFTRMHFFNRTQMNNVSSWSLIPSGKLPKHWTDILISVKESDWAAGLAGLWSGGTLQLFVMELTLLSPTLAVCPDRWWYSMTILRMVNWWRVFINKKPLLSSLLWNTWYAMCSSLNAMIFFWGSGWHLTPIHYQRKILFLSTTNIGPAD